MTNPEQIDHLASPRSPAPEHLTAAYVPSARTPNDLITVILHRRQDPAFAAQLAAIRSALTSATEVYALGHTEPYLAGLPRVAATGARRAAAITAVAQDTLQASPNTYLPLGASLRRLYAVDNPGKDPVTHVSAFTQQVNSLPLLDVESAAAVLSLLVQRCGSAQVPMNFYDLLATLMWWGNGIGSHSRDTRANVVARFYDV